MPEAEGLVLHLSQAMLCRWRAQAGSPSPTPLALCIPSSIPLAVSEADQEVTSTANLLCEAAQPGGVVCFAGSRAGVRPEGDSAGHPTEQQEGSTMGSRQPARKGLQTSGAAPEEERPLQPGDSLANSSRERRPLRARRDRGRIYGRMLARV